MIEALERAMRRARQVGRLTVGRIFGTTPNTDGRYLAIMDLEERAIFCRAEVNAITAILMKKGLFTKDEFDEQLVDELNYLAKLYADKFPEVEFTEIGITVKDVKAFQARSKRERWPP